MTCLMSRGIMSGVYRGDRDREFATLQIARSCTVRRRVGLSWTVDVRVEQAGMRPSHAAVRRRRAERIARSLSVLGSVYGV